MHDTKPAVTFDQQAQRLLDRGLLVPDKDAPVRQLKVVNYYRLSAYWYPYKYIVPQADWQNRRLVLLQKYPEINLSLMGFPDKWLTCPILKI